MRHVHYEQAFEAFLRDRRIPYVSVDDARKSLLPGGVGEPGSLKSFDYVLYGEVENLLVEVKGRRVGGAVGSRRRLENWVTAEDLRSLTAWEGLFGPGFAAALVFVYWCEGQPPDGLFQEVIDWRDRWYAVRVMRLADYVPHAKVRSRKWGTVDLPREAFERLSHPLTGRCDRADAGPNLPSLREIGISSLGEPLAPRGANP
ncbi:MAG: HYExAFE family protein [Phycisphaeraceae bacterium]|nr:HYExAFE family protein [Phycisphaeraceae bacterium]